MQMINILEQMNTRGERILKICTNTAYVQLKTPVHTLAQQLTENAIPSAAVLNESGKVSGIIVSRTLFQLLAKPFGRDLLFRKTAQEVMIKPRTFLYNEYINEIHERIKEDFLLDEIQHYVLVDTKKNFKGIFSSKDLLLHIASVQHQETMITEGIQKKMIPPFLSYETNTLQIVAASIMSQRIGGDYYFIKEIDEQQTFFCLCDISGKGLSAALITAVLAGFMESLTHIPNLSFLVQKLNAVILKSCSLEKYATGIFCIYNKKDESIEYCDMGHGLLYEITDTEILQLPESSGNIPIGVMNLDTITTQKVHIKHNTAYMIVSDGITEQRDENSALFPLNRIVSIMEKNQGNLKKVKIDFFENYFSFKKKTIQHDDASILIASIKKAP